MANAVMFWRDMGQGAENGRSGVGLSDTASDVLGTRFGLAEWLELRLLPNERPIDWPDAERKPMTVIAGMLCDDGSILLCADSQLTESGGVRVTDAVKLSKLEDRPIAWGWSGDESIARDWEEWFRGSDHAWVSWRNLRGAATEELCRLNGRRRHLNRLAGVETKDDDITTILLVGFIGNEPQLIELSDRGGAMPATIHEFVAIGSGHPNARIAYFTVRVFSHPKPVPKNRSIMLRLMEVAIQTCTHACSFPVRLIRVTPERAEEMETLYAS